MSDSKTNPTDFTEPIPNLGSVQRVGPEDGEYMPATPQERQNIQRLVRSEFLRHHSGPLPAPETLAEYERILPGAAERIFVRFEKQSDHRMSIESKVIGSNTFSQSFATVGSVIFSILALFAGTLLVYLGKDVSGLTLFFGAIAPVTATFFYGRHKQEQERERALEQRPDKQETALAPRPSTDGHTEAPEENDSSTS